MNHPKKNEAAAQPATAQPAAPAAQYSQPQPAQGFDASSSVYDEDIPF